MHPFITLGTRQIPAYGLMALIGVLFAGTFAYVAAIRRGLRPVDMIEILAIGAIGVLLGGHVLYALVMMPYWKELSFWDAIGGSVFYGGLIAGILLGFIWVKLRHYPVGPIAEIAACAIPLFHGFARVGCFLGGCCYGIESSFGWIMTDSLSPSGNGVRRFPVSLLEAALNLVLFAFLWALLRRRRQQGMEQAAKGEGVSFEEGSLMLVYLGGYALIRFLDEYLRGDTYRGIYGPFSLSQWISLGIGLFIVVFELIRIYRKKKSSRR